MANGSKKQELTELSGKPPIEFVCPNGHDQVFDEDKSTPDWKVQSATCPECGTRLVVQNNTPHLPNAGVQEASVPTRPKKLLNGGLDPSIGRATQFKPGESGNPAGKAKGTLHLSTHIQRLLNDEEFTAWIPDARDGFKEFKGAPVEAIIKTLMIRAIQGDVKSFDTLAKYGYGTKVELVGKDDGPVQAVVRIVRSGDGPKATS